MFEVGDTVEWLIDPLYCGDMKQCGVVIHMSSKFCVIYCKDSEASGLDPYTTRPIAWTTKRND